MNEPTAIRAENISKLYRIWKTSGPHFAGPLTNALVQTLPHSWWLRRTIEERAAQNYRAFYALRDVSLVVHRGESVGIIGSNGSGKSTLLQLIARTLQPTSGTLQVNGRVAALLELGSGFNPEFTGRENVYLNAAVLGLSRRDTDSRFDAIASFADIGGFLDEPVKTYSSGMFVRLAFAVATHVSADILLIDEALTVGDIFFQQKCYSHLMKLRDQGVAVVLVSHGMNDVEQFCSRAYLLHQGVLVASGPSAEVVKRYYLVNQGPAKPLPTAAESTSSVRQQLETAEIAAGFWPPPAAFLNLDNLTQVTDGTARCTAMGLCDAAGEPCTVFEQGEEIVFYYEFLLASPIEKPITGIVLFNQKQVIVHGKSSLEYGADLGSGVAAGERLRVQHRMKLEVAVGFYSFEVGFASIGLVDAEEAPRLTHFQLYERVRRHCYVSNLGPFEVIFRRNGQPVQLLHHGVANLSGGITRMPTTA